MSVAPSDTLRRLESRIAELPLLPAVVQNLLLLEPGADDYFDHVVGFINADPGFAARLLQCANSAAMGSSRPVTTIAAALLRVGARGAVELILAHSAARIFLPRQPWERSLWVHAILVACLMRRLTPLDVEDRIDADQAYLFGLLHDIGRFVLYLEAPDELRNVDETAWTSPAELVQAEQRICGFTHAELGYLALKKWKLPDDLALAIRHHHDTGALPPDFPGSYVAATHLLHDADWIAVEVARIDPAKLRQNPDALLPALHARLQAPYRRTPEDIFVAVCQAADDALALLDLLQLRAPAPAAHAE